jgi:hypothetical protein
MTMMQTRGGRGAPRGNRPAQPAGRPRSFLVGTQDVLEGGDYDQTVSSGSGGYAAQSMIPWTLQATGWLARLWFYVTYTGTASTGVAANGPFNLFGTIQLNDSKNSTGNREKRTSKGDQSPGHRPQTGLRNTGLKVLSRLPRPEQSTYS